MCACVCVRAVGDVSQEQPCMFTFTFHILSREGEVFEAWLGLQSMLQPSPCLRKQGLKDQKNDHAYSHPNNSILSSLQGMVGAAKHATALPVSQKTRTKRPKERPHIFTSKQLHSLESSRHGWGCKACYNPACVSENHTHVHTQTILTLAEYEHHNLLAPFLPCSFSSWFLLQACETS